MESGPRATETLPACLRSMVAWLRTSKHHYMTKLTWCFCAQRSFHYYMHISIIS